MIMGVVNLCECVGVGLGRRVGAGDLPKKKKKNRLRFFRGGIWPKSNIHIANIKK